MAKCEQPGSQSSLIAAVRAECEGSIIRVLAQFGSKYCNAHNIMGDIRVKRGQIVGARFPGASVTKATFTHSWVF